jgi:hypothetical protein
MLAKVDETRNASADFDVEVLFLPFLSHLSRLRSTLALG